MSKTQNKDNERPDSRSGMQFKNLTAYGFKVLDESKGIVEAIVSVFGNVDYAEERIRLGATKESIERKLPKVAWGHDWKKPIGKTLEARELAPGDPLLPPEISANGGLYVKGQFNLGTQRGKEAFSDITFGSIDEFSIGYRTLESQTAKDGATDLIKLDILEWSPVLIGCNPMTAVISAKDMKNNEKKDFDPSQFKHFKTLPGVNTKGEQLGENVEMSLLYYTLCDLSNMLCWAFWSIVYGQGTPEEKAAAIGEAYDEAKAIALQVAPALLAENATEEEVEKALAGVLYKGQSFFELGQKEGKKFSKKSRKMLTEHCDSMEASCKSIREMLDEDTQTEDDTEKQVASGDVATSSIAVTTEVKSENAVVTAEGQVQTEDTPTAPTDDTKTIDLGEVALFQKSMLQIDAMVRA